MLNLVQGPFDENHSLETDLGWPGKCLALHVARFFAAYTHDSRCFSPRTVIGSGL